MSVRRSWEVWAYLDEVDDARHPVVPLFVAHVRRAAQVAAVGPDTTCNTICPSGCTGCSRHESRVQRKRNELPVNDFELWLSFDRKMARRITRLIGRFSVIRSAGSENQSPPRENCRSRRIDDEHRLSCTEQTIASQDHHGAVSLLTDPPVCQVDPRCCVVERRCAVTVQQINASSRLSRNTGHGMRDRAT